MELVLPAISMSWSFVMIFCSCEIGERVTEQFDVFDITVKQCQWYLMPIELQRMFVIVLSSSQQPVYLHGYGDIQCTRASFKQVR